MLPEYYQLSVVISSIFSRQKSTVLFDLAKINSIKGKIIVETNSLHMNCSVHIQQLSSFLAGGSLN